MRILQVGSSLHEWGGIERYIAYLQEGLRERGHEVDATCPPGSPLDDRLENKIAISVRRKNDLRAFSQYLRLFRERRYDVVHAHFNPDFMMVGFAARLRKQPFVALTRHVALPWSSGKVKLYGSLYDHIIPVSHAVERRLADCGFPEARMTVAKAGCPTLEPSRSPQEVLADLGAGPKFKIGSFGRLAQEKGIDLLFEAARTSPVEFHIFGSGPLLEDFKARKSEVGVKVHGFRSDVADCMNAMDALVIPSRWEEAFPYAALEAMSVGKPLIVSRVGGLLEIVREGETGLAFEKERADELAACATDLAHNPEKARAMGLRAKEIHHAEYTIAKMAERIEAVYQNRSLNTRSVEGVSA